MKHYKKKSDGTMISANDLRNAQKKFLDEASSRLGGKVISKLERISYKAMDNFNPSNIALSPSNQRGGLIPSSGLCLVSFAVIGKVEHRKKGARKIGQLYDSPILQHCLDFARKHDVQDCEIKLIRDERSYSD